MADDDYRRLAAACFCGAPSRPKMVGRGVAPTRCKEHINAIRPVVCLHAKPKFATGRERKACYECRPKEAVGRPRKKHVRSKPNNEPRDKAPRSCLKCGTGFVGFPRQIYCTDACRVTHYNLRQSERDRRQCETCAVEFGAHCRNKTKRWCSEECKPKALRGLFSCLQCGVEYRKRKQAPGQGEKYCGRACAFAARALRKLQRSEAGRPAMCAYFTGHCKDCGAAWGSKTPRVRCAGCDRSRKLAVAKEASRAWNEAKHRARGLVVKCQSCTADFCPLYGFAVRTACPECRPEVEKHRRRVQKARRKARERGVESESVDPLNVFARDRWRCQLCGIKTPRSKRGTCEPDAPELDHILPLALGGPHTYANTQCACRRCNGEKGARPLGQLNLALAI